MTTKPAKWVAFTEVKYKGECWLFQKDLPTPPMTLCLGMIVEDLDGAGEDRTIEEVRWRVSANRVEITFDDDNWADCIRDGDPKTDYEKYGWTQVYGPDDLREYGKEDG